MPTQNAVPEQRPTPPEDHSGKVWLFGALTLVLACACLLMFAYAQHERRQMNALMQTNQSLNASITQLQEQLQSVTERLTRRIEESKPAAAPVTTPPPARVVARKTEQPKPEPHEPVPARDPRVDALSGQFADQQKALASAREDLDRTREDLGKTKDELNTRLGANRDELSGAIGRAREELNSSIAHNHEELVALQRRGERNYFEFSINKSKQFQKVGPVSLELRKVDFKHKSYDLEMLIDDFTLQKKKVNLYEPVWIHLTDLPAPLQLIVNQIDKDKISGYVSAPKYRKSELEQTASAPAPVKTTVQ